MSYSSEKFCLKWNDFQHNIATSYHDLRKDQDFSDVTLVCEENHEIEAHRIILTACSPFFSNVLKRNKHPHPMIYMRGLKVKDLEAILDFIYHGEANIYQEDLDGFLALAEELKLRGLAGSEENTLDDVEDILEKTNIKQTKKGPTYKQEYNFQPNTTEEIDTFNNRSVQNQPMVPVDASKILVAYDNRKEYLKVKLDSMMERAGNGENKWKCSSCGKEIKDRNDMRRHIESHIEGLSYPCNQCDTVSRSSSVLNMHVTRHHKK